MSVTLYQINQQTPTPYNSLNLSNRFKGPVKYNGSLYAIGYGWRGPDPFTGTTVLRVFKSTNSGITWTILDDASAPHTTSDNTVYWPVINGDLVGSILYFAYSTGSAISLITFSLATETWGTAIAGGPSPTTIFRLGFFGTKWTLFYNTISGGANKFRYITYDGGWAAATDIETIPIGTTSNIVAAMNPNNGDMGVLWISDLATNTIKTATLTAAGSLSTPVANSSTIVDFLQDNKLGTGVYSPNTGQFIFPWEDTNQTIYAAVADPGGAPATLTMQTVATSDPVNLPILNPTLDLSPNNATLYCFYELADQTGTIFDKILYHTRPVSSSTWSSATTLINSQTDTFVPPQPGVGGGTESSEPCTSLFSDGSMAFIVGAIAATIFSDHSSSQQFSLLVPANPPIILSDSMTMSEVTNGGLTPIPPGPVVDLTGCIYQEGSDQ